jgi:hypothetical protein
MTDRLPEPRSEPLPPTAAERASATTRIPERARSITAAAPPDALPGPRSPALRDVQAWMVQAICGMHPVNAAAVLTAGPKLSAAERFDVYRDGYRARLRECLRDDYPALAATLGERFEALCDAYIDRHPSTSPSLNAFGRLMAEVCMQTLSEDSRQFMAELARLEWALVEVIHAEAPVALDLEALQSLRADAWGSARLCSADTVRLLRFEHPVNAYYQAFRAHGILGPLPPSQPSATVVYRIGPVLWRMDLTPAMARVLSALLSAATLGEALNQIGVDEHDAAALAEAERSVMIWFREWVQAGFFAEVRC